MTDLCIGVTGHRTLLEPEALERRVEDILQRLARLFAASGLPVPLLTVASPLAEGADRLVAQVVLRRPRARLHALLPLPPDEYRMDFCEQSQQEFDALLGRAEQILVVPPALSRTAAYAAAGLAVLDRCRILIALWDGLPARGVGGTGDVVAEARRRSVPLIWIGIEPPYAVCEERIDRLLTEREPDQRRPSATT